ncbi:DUF1289 domain-containing protein [Methylocystis sp. ATCC 49242]|uniref:DUF1289 domain-containing protein n=1 Tax=Methylocystis sp. ATCC 49242 TaxID=622637 RepID=UPI0001F87A3E|nr:DUF1289 domain-containing protein [Methylocystis sp. ATCC 49242]
MVDSPCVKVCKLNDKGVCTGCGRDLDEIANWMRMSDADKSKAAQRARMRLKTIDGKQGDKKSLG